MVQGNAENVMLAERRGGGSPTSRIVVNTRALRAPLTGVQRYTAEILARVGEEARAVAPPRSAQGALGHLWEQTRLPLRTRGDLLWSPANTGPLAVRRQVVTIHDLVSIDHPEWMGRAFSRWYAFLLPRLARRVTKVLTVSSFTRERVVERFGVDPDRVVAVPNGVDARFRPCAENEIHAARRALGIDGGRYVLCVGSLEPRKNLGRLLQAWKRVRPELPRDLTLVIAGGVGGRRVFGDFDLGALPPGARRLGHVPDAHLPALYAGAVAFVYPSLYEGFGLPLLEAMASGTPTLAGNRSSLPEVAGDAGLLVDPLDVDALADGLRALLTDDALRVRLRARGLERARRFTWERTADQVRRVLHEAAHA